MSRSTDAKKVKRKSFAALLLLFFTFFVPGIRADDTEIYQLTNASPAAGRPQVLIIFDDSGSMDTVIEGQRPPYDPADTSYTYNGVDRVPDDRVYWSTDGIPPLPSSGNYFLTDTNRCASSYTSLADNGLFQTRALLWHDGSDEELCYTIGSPETCFTRPGSIVGWSGLETGLVDPAHVECEADVINGNPSNGSGLPDGYPQHTSVEGEEYGPEPDGGVPWSTNAYTFYSANYLNWYYDTSLREDRTRLQIAQDMIGNLVDANTAIDFGLVLFNRNNDDTHNGGRVVQRLIPGMTDGPGGDRESLVNTIDSIVSGGNTPLCESTMEAYRYLTGGSVVYGYELDPSLDLIPRDTAAEDPAGVYDSPVADCANTYIILMTDGRPSLDTDANSAIETLTGQTCQNYLTDEATGDPEAPYLMLPNCLPELAEYMATDLDGDSSNGEQRAVTYTIGFATDQQLLSDVAAAGGGHYYTADTADELSAALQNAILSIVSTDSTFTSPAVAVDTFTRTQSRNEVFYAMFKPDDRIDWPGNIKRLNISIDNGTAVLVDKNGVPAIDDSSGQIKATATTVWSSGNDGPVVDEGGVGALLASRNPATRTLYINTGANDALQTYGSENITADAFAFASNADLYDFFGVADQDELETALNWGAGYDVADTDGDGSTVDARPWILADMLHSQPLVVNYGARTSPFTVQNPDLRIVAGTNAGFLHMFSNDDGEEDWAFFAKELGPVLNQRRLNPISSQHRYGIDSPPVLYTQDVNRDGSIKVADGDKAYVYFGLRRGGRFLYALDISNPDSPQLLWKIDRTVAGFSELGQTWSVPVITRIPGYADNRGVPKPVLVFGAGYDGNKDAPGLVTPDTMGRGIFVVDAATGALVWSITPDPNSATNLQETGLLHSVAGGITVFDSNGDQLSDRMYFADTGGNVWRADLPGADLPTASQDTWRVVKLGAFNGGTTATDRRFFSAPDVVLTQISGLVFDAVLIGSGDRANPKGTDVDEQFYMIRDRKVTPYFTPAPTSSDCDADPEFDFRCRLPLDPNDLYDATGNLIQVGTTDEQAVAAAALLAVDGHGWRLDLEAPGEKSLSSSITLEGAVYFTTYAPDTTNENTCEPGAGVSRLYALGLLDARGVQDFDRNGNTDRSWIIGTLLADTPSPHFGSDGEIRLLLPPGSGGSGMISSPFLTGATLPDPYGIYWYREEY